MNKPVVIIMSKELGKNLTALQDSLIFLLQHKMDLGMCEVQAIYEVSDLTIRIMARWVHELKIREDVAKGNIISQLNQAFPPKDQKN